MLVKPSFIPNRADLLHMCKIFLAEVLHAGSMETFQRFSISSSSSLLVWFFRVAVRARSYLAEHRSQNVSTIFVGTVEDFPCHFQDGVAQGISTSINVRLIASSVSFASGRGISPNNSRPQIKPH